MSERRRDALRRMAQADESPCEAAIAQAKLDALEPDEPPKARYGDSRSAPVRNADGTVTVKRGGMTVTFTARAWADMHPEMVLS